MLPSRAALILLAFAPASFAAAKQEKGIKGRFLTVTEGVALQSYEGAEVWLVPTEIVADKDRPVDVESVRAMSDESLTKALSGSGLFGSVKPVTAVAPPAAAGGPKTLRVTSRLMLQFGSQALRAFVGSGAGKSKLHIAVDFTDAATGAVVAHFNGYGTGAGLWSMAGGQVQRMAGDDFQENHAELVRLLAARMK